jgi:hypothetical protein
MDHHSVAVCNLYLWLLLLLNRNASPHSVQLDANVYEDKEEG